VGSNRPIARVTPGRDALPFFQMSWRT
jgi:hypothetical protein